GPVVQFHLNRRHVLPPAKRTGRRAGGRSVPPRGRRILPLGAKRITVRQGRPRTERPSSLEMPRVKKRFWRVGRIAPGLAPRRIDLVVLIRSRAPKEL